MSFGIAAVLFCSIFFSVFLTGRLIAKNRASESVQFEPPENAFGSLTEGFASIVPHSLGKRKRIQTELSDAGLHHRNALDNFLSLRNAGLMGWILLSLMFLTLSETSKFSQTDGYKIAAIVLGVSIAIYGVPRIVLSSLASSRKKKIENSLPDALDMIAMGVDGGLPLERALARVSKEMGSLNAALSQELRIIARQSATGSFESAIGNFGKRTSITEVKAWSAIMQNNQKTGGNVVDSLREYADRMRANRRQRIEKTASTASVKLLIPVVLFLAPPVFIVLIGPGLLDFRDFIQRETENHAEAIRQANLPEIERLVGSESR